MRKVYAKRHEDAAQDRGRSERPEGKPWRERKDPAQVPGGAQGAKPFEKRRFAERKPGEVGERKFVRRDAAGGKGGERKPFVKRPQGGPGERRDGEGRPQYWGKRPGKAEREALARGDSPDSRSAGDERTPRGAASEGRGFVKRDGEHRSKPFGGTDRPKRFDAGGDRPKRFEASGDRPKRFEASGDRPRPQGDRAERPQRDFKPKRADLSPIERSSAPRRDEAVAEEGERIAKRLARAGISSRRDAEELIAAGRVKVNGKVLASPAFNVSITDKIELDGMEIPAIERTRLFLFHKPAGVVTTNRDPEGRRTVFDVLPENLPRLMTIGRLDINTEGLLLLTNDGGLSRVLELPATGWLRRYRVRVHGKVDEQALAGLKDGIAVDGVFYGAVEATLEREQGSNAWLTIGLREGKNREVKNILGALGLDVTRLIRVSYGPFQLGELPEGHVLEIKGRMLRDQLGERLVEEVGRKFRRRHRKTVLEQAGAARRR